MRLFQIPPDCDSILHLLTVTLLADWTISSETNVKHYFSYLRISELKTDRASNISIKWFNTVNQLVCLEERLKLIPSGLLLFNRFHVKAGTLASVRPSQSPTEYQQSDLSHKHLRVFIRTIFIFTGKTNT